ncbi:MAG: hypothetical protein HC817_08070 [Saprospiraceae bacterium]|nr:hypothetical protein [Saprospiraceae bacterium]
MWSCGWSTTNSAGARQRIATVNSYTNPGELTREPNQTSAPINLTAGQNYYVELLHKEGGLGDHFAVYWQTPSNSTATIIPGANLVPPCTSNTVMQWSVSNGVCLANDNMSITNRPPVVAQAGIDQELCTTSFTLNATVPSSGTGVWSILSGPGAVTTPTSAASTVTGVTMGETTVLVWTVTDAPCVARDTVVLRSRPLILTAGGDVTYCPGMLINLTANVNDIPMNGGWRWSGPASFAAVIQNTGRPNATLAMGGNYIVTYTPDKVGCPVVRDTVNVNMSTAARATLTAKSTGPYCEGDSIELTVDTVNTSPGGVWEWILPNGATLTGKSITIPNATIAMNGNYTVRYNLNSCDFYASTVVVVKANPTATATNTGPYCYDATISLLGNGVDPSLCSSSNELVFNGNFNDTLQPSAGFLSQYTLSRSTGWGNYTMTNYPRSFWSFVAGPCTDHTSGTGGFLVADGSNSPNLYVWRQNLTGIQPNKFYRFTTWVSNLLVISAAEIRLTVNGQPLAVGMNNGPDTLATVRMDNIPACQWVQVSGLLVFW